MDLPLEFSPGMATRNATDSAAKFVLSQIELEREGVESRRAVRRPDAAAASSRREQEDEKTGDRYESDRPPTPPPDAAATGGPAIVRVESPGEDSGAPPGRDKGGVYMVEYDEDGLHEYDAFAFPTDKVEREESPLDTLRRSPSDNAGGVTYRPGPNGVSATDTFRRSSRFSIEG